LSPEDKELSETVEQTLKEWRDRKKDIDKDKVDWKAVCNALQY